MKAVIPVAGVGTKLRPHTHTLPKPLIPVAGKPILGHIIDNLIAVGIRDQVFVVGYLREKIQDYVESHYKGQIDMEFVVQEPRKGLGHAIWMTREHIQNTEEILIALGDTIFGDDTEQLLAMEGSVLAVQEVDRPGEFGIASVDPKGVVTKLTEKPKIPTSNLALIGMYKIDQVPMLLTVLDEMMQQGIKEDEEYFLTDALMHMVAKGVRFHTLKVEDWFDCGRSNTLLQANQILLSRVPTHNETRFPNSVIIPPVYIAENCDIQHSIIGPFVAIGENAVIRNSIVKNSILGAYSTLDSIHLDQSVVGNDTLLKGKSTAINIGDNTEIDFSE